MLSPGLAMLLEYYSLRSRVYPELESALCPRALLDGPDIVESL